MKYLLSILLTTFTLTASAQKSVTFPNISSIIDTATMNLKPGFHKIIVRYSVNKKISYDTISLQVLGDSTQYALNKLPYCDAGPDKTVPYGQTASIAGAAVDPDGGYIVKYKWTKESGSSYGKISYSTRKETKLTNLRRGVYVFRLTVTDNHGGEASDDVKITVE